MELMWFLMLAHLVGDFALQTDRMARTKGESPGVLTLHVAIYCTTVGVALLLHQWLVAAAISWTVTMTVALAAIFVIHSIQDFVKSNYFAKSHQAYYADQALHVIQLFVLRWLVS